MRHLLLAGCCIVSYLSAFEPVTSQVNVKIEGKRALEVFSQESVEGSALVSIRFHEETDPVDYYEVKIKEGSERGVFVSSGEKIACRFFFWNQQENFFSQEKKTVIAHSVAGEEVVPVDLRVEFEGKSEALPGFYEAILPIQIVQGETIREENLTLSIEVLPEADIMITDGFQKDFSKTKYVVWDFGLVESQIQRDAIMQVRANYPFQLQFESRNQGKLALANSLSEDASGILYKMVYDQEEIDLGSGKYILGKVLPKTNRFGVPKSLQVTLYPELKENFAGVYKDQILITVVAPF